MKYCTECGSEYEDGVTACADDGNPELVSAEEMRRRGIPLAAARDTRNFVRIGTAEDPLSSERFTAVLEQEGIPVITRARRGGTVDNITGGSFAPWWEFLVPEEHAERAQRILSDAKQESEAGAEEAARAAEDEAGQS